MRTDLFTVVDFACVIPKVVPEYNVKKKNNESWSWWWSLGRHIWKEFKDVLLYNVRGY